ncbi:hypothetical protein [Streptomyces sp. NBC_00233]|uniref:hypothetical protein n=1 Tax=Streptomyces sp. NBC_00233 TaxID=2975686 RepID=UPI002250098B|nr:hypothetical protein [Streptomyces sp. NBC_00233]MCX5225310.1 hypothetical protein [Streptomyces sp. NBC_00233]
MVFARRGRRPRLAALAAASVLVLTPVVAGCSDDGAGGGEGRYDDTETSTVTTAPAGADEPDDPAAAKAEITKNWTAFFAPETPAAERVKLLENGEQMQEVLGAFGGDKNAALTSAKVTGVEFTSATEANVTYDLLVGGAPALSGAQGTSVLQNDTWKVTVKTLCGLVQLSGVTVPGC